MPNYRGEASKNAIQFHLHSRKNLQIQLGFELTHYGIAKEPFDLSEVEVIFSCQKNCLFSTLCIECWDAIHICKALELMSIHPLSISHNIIQLLRDDRAGTFEAYQSLQKAATPHMLIQLGEDRWMTGHKVCLLNRILIEYASVKSLATDKPTILVNFKIIPLFLLTTKFIIKNSVEGRLIDKQFPLEGFEPQTHCMRI